MSNQEIERSMWSFKEVYALLGIWCDSSILSKLDGTTRNAQVYRDMCSRLAEKGYGRTVNQIKYKMKNLKKEYRKVTDHNNRSGRERRTIKYQEELSLILGDRPSANPISVKDVGCAPIPDVTVSDEEEYTSEASSTSSYIDDEIDVENDIEQSDQGAGRHHYDETEEIGVSPRGPSPPISPTLSEPVEPAEPDLTNLAPGPSREQLPGSSREQLPGPSNPKQKRRASTAPSGSKAKQSRRKGLMSEFVAYQSKADEVHFREERRREKEQMEAEEKWRRESLEQDKRFMDSMSSFMSTMTDVVKQTTQAPNRPQTMQQQQQQQQQQQLMYHQPWQNPPRSSFAPHVEQRGWPTSAGQRLAQESPRLSFQPDYGVDLRFLPK